MACVLAPESKRDEAITNLKFAEDHALSADGRNGLEEEPDLRSLHGHPRFDALAADAHQRLATAPK